MAFNRAYCIMLPLLAGLSACATPADQYPSLAIRDVERVVGTADPVVAPPYVPPAPAAATLDRLTQLQSAATAAHAAFIAQEARDRGVIARLSGAATGSDGWAVGLAALAELQGARSRTMVALADLDRIHVDAAVAGEDLSRVAAVRDAVAALVAQEDAMIDRAAR